jgi:hypothetical protein
MSDETTPVRGPRCPYNKVELTPLDKGFKEALLGNAVKQLLDERAKNGGATPHRLMKKLVEGLKKYPCLSDAKRSTLHNHVARYIKKKEAENGVGTETVSPEAPPRTVTPPTIDNRTKGGRPKGSTMEAKLKQDQAHQDAGFRRALHSTRRGRNSLGQRHLRQHP